VIDQDLEPSVEVAHLRRLLDIQPSCLMRVSAAGTVLAANDAALTLLGVTSGAQALGRDFAAWVPPDQVDRWRAFAIGVVRGFPSSIEFDITAPGGDRHPTLLHGVPLPEHPDGVASMAVAARAVSGQRKLEAAVVELEEQLRERDEELLSARVRLAELEASRRLLVERVAALEAGLQEREAESDEQGRRLRQLAADVQARDEALAQADAARRAADADRARALVDVRQLEMALEGFAARQQRTTAELAAERQGALQARLDEALAACQEREAALSRLESAHETLAAAHAAAIAEHERLVSAVRKHASQLAALADGAGCSAVGSCASDGIDGQSAGREEEGRT
jgi:hypothetical protein